MLDRIIRNSFYALFLVTPLLFTPLNSELFEYNKMMFVYLMSVFIGASWFIKMVNEEKLILKRTPLDIPILIFYLSQVISTVISMDPHTSVWGYYSRSNGGLMSISAYLLLYYALVSNFKAEDAIKFLKAMLWGGLAVALYAIPEHFGVSPSCALLVSRFSADCWVQDVQTRVFATLGQPNWLGGYLTMILFPAIYFFLTSKNTKEKILYYISIISYYLGLTFTLSRGAFTGFLGGIAAFTSFWLVQNQILKRVQDDTKGFWSRFAPQNDDGQFKLFSIVLISFLLINLVFGSALTRFKLFVEAPPPPKPQAAASTQLETGGTESGQIRLIVWEGALEIFKAYPLFGSGVETFAYSYYNFRPSSHNLVSEWDFLYNKAHNEFLNYLATTGAVGFLSYMFLIGAFVWWSIIKISNFKFQISNKLQISNIKLENNDKLLILSLLAGYISYLIQNFFGFSVVMIALLFYLYPGFAFLVAGDLKEVRDLRYLGFLKMFLRQTIFKRSFNKKLTLALVGFVAFFFIFTLYKFWVADTYYKIGTSENDEGNPGAAYNELIQAVNLNPGEPLYRSELGYAAGSAAVALETDDPTRSAQLVEQSVQQTDFALSQSPANVSLWRTAIRTFFELSFLDSKYEEKTLEVVDRSIELAPTDPKLLYNRALILDQFKRTEEATPSLQKAIDLKPNYQEAYVAMGDYLVALDKKDEAKGYYKVALKLVPSDSEVMEKLKGLE